MLDDLKMIHEKDAQDTLGVVADEWQQLQQRWEPVGNRAFGEIRNVVYGAMGGSAVAADLVATWPGLPVPLEIVRDYNLPGYVNAHTLVVLSSFSGNTEETLSALKQAEEKGAQIAVLTAGGQLKQIAEDKDYLLIVLPQNRLARCTTFVNWSAALEIFTVTGLVQREDYESALEKASHFLKTEAAAWLPDVATANNPAKQLAQELMGKSLVIYSGAKLHAAAYKWKIGFNENAKQVAWVNQLPEFNHNEFTGWSKQPVDKPYAVIDLRSNLEHERVQKRFEVTARLLSGMRPEPIVVEAKGQTLLEQLVWTINFGDFVSLYLSLLNGQNPMPLDLVDKLKGAL